MPIFSDPDRARFTITGPDVEPVDVAWLSATPADRRAYYGQLAVEARDRKLSELNRGIGVDGSRLPPRRHPRHDRARGPVLSPHYSDSRFETELRTIVTETECVLYWRNPWGRIVSYHARGGPHTPIRNVIGLTHADLQKAVMATRLWWAGRVSAGRVGEGAVTAGPGVMQRAVDILKNWWSGRRVKPPSKVEKTEWTKHEIKFVREPVVMPTAETPPHEIARSAWAIAQRRYEGISDQSELDRFVNAIRRTQRTPALRELVKRLGADPSDLSRNELLEVLSTTLKSRKPI